MIPATRAEARAVGSKHYYPGTECANGHIAARFTSCGYCTECSKQRAERKRDELLAYYKARYEAKKPDILARQRIYCQNNRELLTAKAVEWSHRNPERRKAISRQYKAKRRSQEEAGITGGVLAAWTAAQPKVCFYCGAECDSTFHIDHFMPLSKGGAHVLTNLRIACAPCNLRKSDKDPMRWLADLAA